MWNQNDDLEAPLNPSMEERPELRWAFIRKVYSILTLQLLATIGFAAIVASVHPIANFFSTTKIGLVVFIAILIVPFIVICLIYIYKNKHPLNFVLLGIFTLCFGLAIGVFSAYVDGKIIIEAGIATAVVVISLTLYTFWAAKKGHDFSFMAPFLLSLVVIMLMFAIFQVFFPMGKISEVIYSGLAVIVFSAYIIYNTFIKRNSYDQYIWASLSLYSDVFNLFLRLLQIIGAIFKR
ncbi:hypothetical protein ACS0TY_036033 [Phlomoides rotata]